MQTNEKDWIDSLRESLGKAKVDLSKADYLAECGSNAGLRKMNENKANWLRWVVYLAELGLEAEQLFIEQDKPNSDQQVGVAAEVTSEDLSVVETIEVQNKKLEKLESQYKELKQAYDSEIAYRDELVLRAFIDWSTSVVAKAHDQSWLDGSVLVCPVDVLDQALIDASWE